MKLVIIRHGDPDYSVDSLTPTGWKEAELLAKQLVKNPADYYYTSPLGRAKDTASLTLKALGREAEILPWLREFTGRIFRPNRPEKEDICWDWLPQDWMNNPRFFSGERWFENEVMRAGNVQTEYNAVIRSFDAFLERHGYARDGQYYRAIRANNDTVVLFCHFAIECVLLSRLLNCSPMILWHGFCAAPTSVTTVVTEERRPGIASFRILRFGDISHLAIAGQEPSFAARFCEKYGNPGERTD